MATETVDEMSSHMRGLTVTTIAAVAGLAAGVVTHLVTGDDPTNQIAIGILAVAILVQFPLLQVVGVEYGSLGIKDKLYVAFMTFALWFISWGILLTTTTAA